MKFVFICSPFWEKQENTEKAKRYCRILVDMEFCDELWVFGDEITEGMIEEIELSGK